jgi:hypothetical protein
VRWGNGCETRNRVPGMFSHTSLAASFHAVLGMLAESGSRARASTWRKLCFSTVCIGNRHDVQRRLPLSNPDKACRMVQPPGEPRRCTSESPTDPGTRSLSCSRSAQPAVEISFPVLCIVHITVNSVIDQCNGGGWASGCQFPRQGLFEMKHSSFSRRHNELEHELCFI